MRIGILHLSDIHFEETSSAWIQARALKVSCAFIAAEPDCLAYLILVSGDVAYSGKSKEYEIEQERRLRVLPRVVCPSNRILPNLQRRLR